MKFHLFIQYNCVGVLTKIFIIIIIISLSKKFHIKTKGTIKIELVINFITKKVVKVNVIRLTIARLTAVSLTVIKQTVILIVVKLIVVELIFILIDF